MDRSDIERRGITPRGINPPPIKAEYYEGDKFTGGSIVQEAHCAVLGISHKSNSKGILAGSMDNNKDVGIGGKSESIGVFGTSNKGIGVWCESNDNEALHAETKSIETAAIAAYNINPESKSTALYAKKYGSKGSAAVFDGNVDIIAGDLNVKTGLIKINGQSVWELIYNLQAEIDMLKIKVFNAQETANDANNKAIKANDTANNANNNAKKALDKINA